MEMQLKINSFNSKVFTNSTYIDVTPEIARQFIERAQNVSVDLSLETFKVRLELNLQCSSLMLMNPSIIQLTVSPRKSILQYGHDGFLPVRTKVFRPL
jgi:hypothetical protein